MWPFASIFIALAVAGLAWALVYWDIEKRKLGLEQYASSTLKGETANVKRDLERVSQDGKRAQLLFETMDRQHAEKFAVLLPTIESHKAAIDMAGARFADLDQRTAWCEQNIKDLGKTPPARKIDHATMGPFGRK